MGKRKVLLLVLEDPSTYKSRLERLKSMERMEKEQAFVEPTPIEKASAL